MIFTFIEQTLRIIGEGWPKVIQSSLDEGGHDRNLYDFIIMSIVDTYRHVAHSGLQYFGGL